MTHSVTKRVDGRREGSRGRYHTAGTILATGFTLTVALSACGRSSDAPTGGTPPTGGSAGSTPAPASSSTGGLSAGTFGDLKNICGPGTANGATGRGITAHLDSDWGDR